MHYPTISPSEEPGTGVRMQNPETFIKQGPVGVLSGPVGVLSGKSSRGESVTKLQTPLCYAACFHRSVDVPPFPADGAPPGQRPLWVGAVP